MHWNQRDWLLLAAITLLAALLRFYQLGVTPPGFQFDEAFNAIDAQQVLDGNRPLFLPANGGREALYTYYQAALARLFGMSVYTLRMASALAGTVTVAASYLLFRRLLRRDSQLVAAFASLTLAVTLWHVHFSHYGIRVILMPLIFSGVFGFFWLGLEGATRRARLAGFALSGLLLGLAPWANPTGRLAPLALLLAAAWLLLRQPERRRWGWDGPVGGLLISGALALLVFLPLGLEFIRHPDFFFGHASEVSIFADRVSGGAWAPKLAENVLHVLGMFALYGDVEWAHGPAGRPIFDPLMGIVFMGGGLIWLWRLRRTDDEDFAALSTLAAWTLVMLMPSVFSEAAPNYSRTLPSLPAVFTAAGLGLAWLALRPWRPAWVGAALAAGVVAMSGVWSFYDYFVRFPQNTEVYYLFDADKLDALDALSELTGENRVYLSQLWGDGHATVYFLRGRRGVASLDSSDTIVLPPSGQGAVYAFPWEQRERAERLASLWPGAVTEELLDKYDRPLLALVRLDAESASGWPAAYTPDQSSEARFMDAPTLLGMQAVPGAGDVTLFWRSDAPTLRDLTTFVHLLDGDGKRVGQSDELPGNGSYLTPYWAVGERVIERYFPEITDACVGGEEVRVQVGWYQYLADGARMARTDGPGDTALAGRMTVPPQPRPADQLVPPHALDGSVAAGATLAGYGLEAEGLEPAAPLVVDLYWRNDGEVADSPPLTLLLSGDGGDWPLWSGAAEPAEGWDAGELLCRRLRLHLPADAAPGDYTLRVAAPGGEVDLQTLALGPSTRRFTPPAFAQPADAVFGEQIALAGYTIGAPAGGVLPVELVWQAVAPSGATYHVFLHLVDAEGQIVAQADAAPGGGDTGRWVAGEYVVDGHSLSTAGAAPGRYTLLAGLYDPVSGERLPVRTGNGAEDAGGAIRLGEAALP